MGDRELSTARVSTFRGHCVGDCDDKIEVGEMVVPVGDWGWRHEEC